MKKIYSVMLLLIFFSICHADPIIVKSPLKVLYVGGSADWTKEYFQNDTAAYSQNIRERMASFEKLFKQYFDSVKVIYAVNYSQEMSDNYDVTVMDGVPRPVYPMIREKDAAGKIINYKPAGYISEEFTRPMITIGELGDKLGGRIGLKADWYCLCLDADAHHFVREHPIFKGPFPVKMTVKTKKTPSEANHYKYFYEGEMPDSIPMWQVQTKGYKTDDYFRVGMVARPWGFTDSPDAEYISSGVCAKTLDAVAIGRHGNFLHWGFAASPAYMTEEAKTVLANAVVYIAQFAGQGVMARKYNSMIATRSYVNELKHLSGRVGYEDRLKFYRELDEMMAGYRKMALEKQAKGEKLTQMEGVSLEYKTPPTITFEEFIKQSQKELYAVFGTDSKAYAAYYDSNRDYFYGGEGIYNLVVDEDVKSLGIPNNDKRLLDKAIKMLEKGNDTDKAKRILSRYTLCDFSTPSEWRTWYETNKKRLYFTESGGWLFLINTREPVVGNDYHVRDAKPVVQALKTDDTDDQNPVSVAAGIDTDANGHKKVMVKIKIHPGYHIYANVAKSDPFIATTVKMQASAGCKLVGELKKPSFKAFNENGTMVYENEVTFIQDISGVGTVKCIVGYQCCDNHICMPPVEKEFSLEVK